MSSLRWRAVKGLERLLTVDYVIRRCAQLPPAGSRRYVTLPEGVSERPAAVLVPVVDLGGEAGVVVTKRAAHMSTHRNDWVFPGGSLDAIDASASAAAVREASEELGIDRGSVAILGELDSYGPIVTGHVVRVFVGLLSGQDLTPDPAEVAETAVLRLSQFQADGAYYEDAEWPADYVPTGRKPFATGNDPGPQPFFRIRTGEVLWGAQGVVLSEFLEFLATGLDAAE